MSSRVIHSILSECDISVHKIGHDTVRVRITERDPDILNPTDVEIEGDAIYILEALSSAALVLNNINDMSQREPN